MTVTANPPKGPANAIQAPSRAAGGDRKDVAEGVRTALGSDPRQGDGRRPVAWLRITAPPDWTVTPSGRSWCACGHDQSATGRAAVAVLVEIHEQHRTLCPLLSPLEGRAVS